MLGVGSSNPNGAIVRRLATFLPALLTFVLLGLLWEAAVRIFEVPLYLLPPPSMIVRYIAANLPLFLKAAYATSWQIIVGFLISAAVGIPLGILLARSRLFAVTVYPLLVASQTFPKLAIGPLFVVWFGFGSAPKLLLAGLLTFFPIMIDSMVGLRSVQPDTLMLARSMGFGRLRSFFRIQLPQALPSIFAGLRVGSTLAVIGVLVAEFLGTNEGLGYLIITATGNIDTVLLFSALVVVAAIGLGFYGLVALLEWQMIGRRAAVGRTAH